nr:unnamed protein product [Digitaria exilis]
MRRPATGVGHPSQSVVAVVAPPSLDTFPESRRRRARHAAGSDEMEDGVSTYTVDEALVFMGFGKFHAFVLAYSGMAKISEAMEMMLLSFVGQSVQAEWELSAQAESLITSVVFLGMLAVMPAFGWRWLLALSSLPSFALLLFYPVTLESPRYLCMKGRIADAVHVLETMARVNRVSLPSGRLVSGHRTELHEMGDSSEMAQLVANKKNNTGDLASKSEIGGLNAILKLLSPNLIRSTLLLWTVFLGHAFLYYGLVLLTSELNHGNRICGSDEGAEVTTTAHINDENLYRNVFITSFGEVPGLLLSAAIVDKMGRKLSMSSMLYISCLCIAPLMFTQTEALTTVFLFGARVCISASFTVLHIYAPEIYPTAVRATGVGFASSVARFGGILCPLVAVGLVHACHQTAAILIFITVMLVSGIAVSYFPLETSGRKLSDHIAA